MKIFILVERVSTGSGCDDITNVGAYTSWAAAESAKFEFADFADQYTSHCVEECEFYPEQ